MFCKRCKTKMVTTVSKYNDTEQELYRRRVCPNCGHAMYTVEFEAEQNDRFEEDWSKSYKLIKKSVDKPTKDPVANEFQGHDWVQEDMFDDLDRLWEVALLKMRNF